MGVGGDDRWIIIVLDSAEVSGSGRRRWAAVGLVAKGVMV